MDTHNYIELEEQYGAHNYHPLDVSLKKAKACGSGMWTAGNISTVSRPTRPSTRGTGTPPLSPRSWRKRKN